MNHIANHKLLIRPEANNNQKNRDYSKVEEKKAREAERYGFQKDGQDRPLTKINSVRHQYSTSDYEILAASTAQYRAIHTNGPENKATEQHHKMDSVDHSRAPDPESAMMRSNSLLQLEQWIRTQRDRATEEESRGVTNPAYPSPNVMSYQTLPRNMPSYRAQVAPRYPEGYRTLPRNPKPRPESLCSTTGMGYDRTTTEDKRRSIRDDTMWQLYEWQQRQFYNKQTTLRRHASLTSPKTMAHISEQALHSMPLSPSHGSISGYNTYSPHRAYRSEVSSPVQRGDVTIDRKKAHPSKHAAYTPDRRSMPAGLPLQPITPQGLQGKSPEELTLLLIKLRRQQAELSSVRDQTLAQLMHLKQSCSPKEEILSHHLQRNLIYADHQMKENEPLITMVHTMIENSALRPQLYQQMTQDECRSTVYKYRSDEVDIDAKLSSLCEQDKVVQALEKKLQQLHKEKYTLEQALLSASQEIEMNTDNPAAIQSVVLQRDDLQNGLLSTCREVSRATAELERSWKDYDTLEHDVTATRNQMREQLDRLGEVQTESAGIQRAQMQKEIWRIQDVMEGLSKKKQQRRSADTAGNSDSHLFSSGLSTNEGPDYRLYKSEPELTTVAEVDESNGDDKADHSLDHDTSTSKGSHFPVGVVPPRTKSPPLESTTIASYVTLRKNKKLETKSERPRSAVEHLCIADSPRPRMTVEEQLERMRRHQQACLKEKKRGLSFIGTSDQSLSQSPSISRENSFKITQVRKREEKLFSNIKDLENAVRENNLEQQRESPAQEILRLKEAAEEPEAQKESADSSPPESKDEPTKDDAQQPDPTDALQALVGTSLEVVSVANHKSESSQSENKTNEQERTGIIFYEFSSDALRRHTSLEGDLSSLPEPPTLPVGPAQPQLTEGSHFMCV
ncbi:pleckstrin homology domain-containing family A member 5 isoform 5-T5 [Discoglossus pictus]